MSNNNQLPNLGAYLRDQRMKIDRSLRWIEAQSKQMYPTSSLRHISNGHLKQIESDDIKSVHPLKLQTLAKIYKVDYMYLLKLAGYISKESSDVEEITSKLRRLTEKQRKNILSNIDMLLDINN